ncbi:ankyrin repeat domain-containing protein [Pectobacterium versatile]|uniref:ankyrin repeat domain-containing protein n=1 Tax=Pectobacterium versatile TaxID=2488639 RepID=UPI001F2BE9E7|nr:ankyrin repeat domain-containing protein [Pectobacterium versatile]
MNNKFNSIADVFSEMIRGFSNPSYTNELGQNLIFEEFTWNSRDLDALKSRGFDINKKDNSGKIPIFYCKRFFTFQLLLAYMSNRHHLDNDNRNLLFFENHIENIKTLLVLGMDLNVIDSFGNNFLSYAPFHQYPELFTDKLNEFSGDNANIFQFYEKSEEALKLLKKESIKFTLSPKITLNYNPQKEKNKITSLLSYLKDKIEEDKIRFIYSPSDGSPAQIYTLHQLSNII